MTCPTPTSPEDTIVMAHGGGGKLSAQLISSLFLPAFANEVLLAQEDQARFDLVGGRLALTTDAFVVNPIFFPGGDIGRLSVCGTVNDLVVGGARPAHVTAAFILEEGLAIDDLRRIALSMARACEEAGITLVAGDTKVVDRGKGDKVYITTTGLGVIPKDRRYLSAGAVKAGDAIIVSGTIGDHGVAVMSVREGLELETTLESDVAPLGGLVETLIAATNRVRCMRDPTRGGVATVLHEVAQRARVSMRIREKALPVRPEVRGACEILGLDPLYVANEGKLVAFVRPDGAEAALQALRSHPLGKNAAIIGEVRPAASRAVVTLETLAGGERLVPLLAGEQLPRIC